MLHPILVDKKSPPAGCTIDIQITDGFLDVNYGAWRWKTYDEAKVLIRFFFPRGSNPASSAFPEWRFTTGLGRQKCRCLAPCSQFVC